MKSCIRSVKQFPLQTREFLVELDLYLLVDSE